VKISRISEKHSVLGAKLTDRLLQGLRDDRMDGVW